MRADGSDARQVVRPTERVRLTDGQVAAPGTPHDEHLFGRDASRIAGRIEHASSRRRAVHARGHCHSIWLCQHDGPPMPFALPERAAIASDGRVHGLPSCHDGVAVDEVHAGRLARVLRLGDVTVLQLEGGVRALVGGRPIPGGIARVCHGDMLGLRGPGGGEALRYWFSAEGPRHALPAPRPGVDALTRRPFAAGTPVVRCACGAVQTAACWQAVRRCAGCGAREDGVYRELPPDRQRFAAGGAPCAS